MQFLIPKHKYILCDYIYCGYYEVLWILESVEKNNCGLGLILLIKTDYKLLCHKVI